IRHHQVVLTEPTLSQPFQLPYIQFLVITQTELFKTTQNKQPKPTKTISNPQKIKSYQDLNVADYMVHVHHGAG
ncbi:hypothetical protein, partial [Staphylococcus epidermidis]|uniref:hypothetical protein n=1 Tax=Staphylococcus epidermidis TaxID=1282 RepID=UPI00119D02A6